MTTERCIIDGCHQIATDVWTQTCGEHFTRYESVRTNNTTSTFRYPCRECQRTRWFQSEGGTCECCRRSWSAGDDDLDDVECTVCGATLTYHNTPSNARYKGGSRVKCGKCYLKWKAEERKRKGEK